MTIQELLFRLGVLSKSKAYQPIVYAIELRLSSEGWDPSLKKLQQEVAKVHACTYDTFKQNIRHVIDDIWSHNRERLNELAFLELEDKPTVSEFLDILYVYLARNREQGK